MHDTERSLKGHGRPFVPIPGGYTPDAVAKVALEEASERQNHRSGS